MSGRISHVSRAVDRLRRYFAGGRHIVPHMRYELDQSARTQLPPVMKPSVNHLLSKNDYHERDGRRLVERPQELFSAESGNVKRITSGEDVPPITETQPSKSFKRPVPGFGQTF